MASACTRKCIQAAFRRWQSQNLFRYTRADGAQLLMNLAYPYICTVYDRMYGDSRIKLPDVNRIYLVMYGSGQPYPYIIVGAPNNT